ncbi:MAG: hypothetical protein CME57_06150 [Halieaceae bacterium]|nr:hypothetical protein [Halieaceae bacterium]
MRQATNECCACCQRAVPLTFHHLIPKKVHRREHFKRHFSKETLQAGIRVCRLCHRGIHREYDEMKLARELNSLERLREDEILAKHFKWVAKQREQ